MTPRTEAGRTAVYMLTHDIWCARVECDCTVAEHIAAIAAEARKQALDEAIAAVLQAVTHERVAERMSAVGAPRVVHEGVKHSVNAAIDALTRLRDEA